MGASGPALSPITVVRFRALFRGQFQNILTSQKLLTLPTLQLEDSECYH